jgi:hypothetical protein
MARVTGLEPAASGVTGRRSNQLSYTRVLMAAKYCTDPTLSMAERKESVIASQIGLFLKRNIPHEDLPGESAQGWGAPIHRTLSGSGFFKAGTR